MGGNDTVYTALVLGIATGVAVVVTWLDTLAIPQEQTINETSIPTYTEEEVNEDSLMCFYVDPSQPEKGEGELVFCATTDRVGPVTKFESREDCLKWLADPCGRYPDDRCIVAEILTLADIKEKTE